jgi:hypothetical protein
MDVLREQLRKLGIELEEIPGARLFGELPVPAAIVNRAIAAKLAGSKVPVSEVRVDPLDQQLIDIHVTPSSRLVPAIRVQARIERQPELPGSAQLVLRWSIPAAGPLARLASPFIANLKSLPPGVRIEGDLVIVDLHEVLAAQGHGELLEYVKALRVDTRPGAFVVRFDAAISSGSH